MARRSTVAGRDPRSRALEAFRLLMLERGYRRLTIQSVLDRARIGRATFYTHFRGKEDLLAASVAGLGASLESAWDAARASGRVEPFGFARPLLRHAAGSRRMLGVLERGRTPAGLSTFLFAQPQLGERPPVGAHTAIQEWRELQESAQSIRSKLRDTLLERCGCFQGAARTANGVDIARIVEYFGTDGDKLDLEVLEPLDAVLRGNLANMREAAVNVRAKRVLAEAVRLAQALQDELGENFDKNEVADALNELAKGMQGNWHSDELGMTAAAFKRLCEDFRASALKEALGTVQASVQLDEDKNDSKALSRIAQLDVNSLIVAHSFLIAAIKVTTAARRRADMIQGQTEGLDIGAQVGEIRATFEQVVGDMDALEVQGEKECS